MLKKINLREKKKRYFFKFSLLLKKNNYLYYYDKEDLKENNKIFLENRKMKKICYIKQKNFFTNLKKIVNFLKIKNLYIKNNNFIFLFFSKYFILFFL
jgi:hypothetical protein